MVIGAGSWVITLALVQQIKAGLVQMKIQEGLKYAHQ